MFAEFINFIYLHGCFLLRDFVLLQWYVGFFGVSSKHIANISTQTGIFPGKCFPILAREITQEELQMVSCHLFCKAKRFFKAFMSACASQFLIELFSGLAVEKLEVIFECQINY